jgi:hypothetical protein
MLSDANSSDEDSGPGPHAEGCAREPHAQYHPLPVSLADYLPQAPKHAGETSEDAVFTVMIRQIPRHYTQLKFLAKLSCSGFHGLVDFIYFPVDVKKGTNVGYGFINFTEPRHTAMFQQEFGNVYLDMEMRSKEKPVRTHPAAVQGYENNFLHFMNTRTGQKADLQYSPLFMPQGSWASLSEDVRAELMKLREAFTSRPPGQLEAEAPGPLHGTSQRNAGTGNWTSGEPQRTSFLSAGALESHDVAQRDLCTNSQARGRDLRADGLEDDSGREECTPSAPAPWDKHPAKISPLGQLRPPPGLQPTRSFSPRCWPRAPQEPTPLKLQEPAPWRPPPPEGQFWSTAEPHPPWNHRSSSGHGHPAASSVPAAPFEDFIGTYQQLEERRQKLLSELLAVQEEQRRAIVSVTHARPPSPSAACQFDSHRSCTAAP